MDYVLTVVANSEIDTNTRTSCNQLSPQDLLSVTAHTMTSYGHVASSVTSCYVISCVKRPSSSEKNCGRSIWNVVMSQLWRHRVMWLHHHQSNAHGHFCIGSIDNKAELSQRRLHDAPNVWVPRKISTVLTSLRLLFPQFVTGVCSDRY